MMIEQLPLLLCEELLSSDSFSSSCGVPVGLLFDGLSSSLSSLNLLPLAVSALFPPPVDVIFSAEAVAAATVLSSSSRSALARRHCELFFSVPP